MKYSKFEFLAALIILVVFLFTGAGFGTDDYDYLLLNGKTTARSPWGNIIPYWGLGLSAFAGFLILNFYVVPKYLLQQRIVETIGLIFCVLLAVGSLFMVSYSYIKYWMYNMYPNLTEANMALFSRGMIMACACLFCYSLYVLMREIIRYQHKQTKTKQNISSRINREVALVFSVWLGIMLPFLLLQGTGLFRNLIGFFFFMLPYCFIIYFLNLYWLIPGYKQGRIRSGLLYFYMLVATCIIFGFIEIAFLLQTQQFSFLGNLVFFWLIPTAIVISISWQVYRTNEAMYMQLSHLQTALGTSNTSLQYLRSQINPHFLFNALNTLYGTALMEKAEKTGEGIQKLGDMMRFMLHENNQDKIALSREIAYLHNYIDLQNMRLALSPDLVIEIEIEDIVGYYEIAPMLLIPFVENAYKHGISLQQRSWINVNLYKKDDHLHLDVHNSIHPVNVNDPERYQSGTGLDNVKQRLQLIYPDKHELVIRQNAKEFFVHLTLILTAQTL